MKNDSLPRDDNGQLSAYAWPGGYPIFYIVADNGILCPDCARWAEKENRQDPECRDDDQWRIIAADVNYEDPALYCDNCSKRIESAYAEERQTEDF